MKSGGLHGGLYVKALSERLCACPEAFRGVCLAPEMLRDVPLALFLELPSFFQGLLSREKIKGAF
jgi:hypothetical protein